MGNDINIISLEAMKNIYEVAATNLKLAREKGDPQGPIPPTKSTTWRYSLDTKSQ